MLPDDIPDFGRAIDPGTVLGAPLAFGTFLLAFMAAALLFVAIAAVLFAVRRRLRRRD